MISQITPYNVDLVDQHDLVVTDVLGDELREKEFPLTVG
jgi:hypothetical protein